MKLDLFLWIGVLFFTLSSFTQLTDVEMKWAIVGHKQVDYKIGKDNIPLKFPDRKFTAVRISIQGGEIKIHHCVITFSNGETQSIPLRKKLQSGNMSKIVDLKGGKRSIDKFEVYYHPDFLNRKKATLELWGRSESEEITGVGSNSK